MTTYNRLRKEALESCKLRGHSMTKFFWSGERRGWAACTHCGMMVKINATPAPNDIHIGGEAVALNCKP